MFITLGEYKKRRVRKSRKKIFRGWIGIHSKTGSNWGLYDEWEVITDLFPTAKEAREATVSYPLSDCCPRSYVKLYY